MLLTAVRNGELLLDRKKGAEDFDDAFADDDEFPEPPADFEPEAHRMLVDAVAEIVSTRAAAPASDVALRLREREREIEYGLCPGDAGLIGEAVALGILLDLRYGPAQPDACAAVRWVAEQLGPEHGDRALGVADLLGHPGAPHWSTVQPPHDDEPLLPALVLLLAGVASTTPGVPAD
ncbi:hypothetical protein GCM10020369_69850 [Cryptosporangium minutisporangium]|uniref:Uncharacterized protein n=2 Tax=Cryptosporangium minutisporangium TaxID=113569 RepID=A0ABP6T854_9ACTN